MVSLLQTKYNYFHSLTHGVLSFFILFLAGFLTSFLFQQLQFQYHILIVPFNNTSSTVLLNQQNPQYYQFLLLHLQFGLLAVLCGYLYPYFDKLHADKINKKKNDWSSVMRCVGGLIGVNYAATKLSFNSSIQVSLILALISIALWFLFDFTKHGFLLSLAISFLGTLNFYFHVYLGGLRFTKADFFGVRSYIPCVLYASCICYGSIGRQLYISYKPKQN
ncbi:insulin-induced [Neoconidiobolus thromboides FSU 785]|nr:insulin-induced [Neoconidiobolus thromboides FSU 785]